MSYSPDSQIKIIDENIKRLQKAITICEKVEETLSTAGWKDVIGPIIDREIIDVVGGKIGDTWVSGKVSRARSEEKREYWIGYKQGLINLHNRIIFHLDELRRNKESLAILLKDKDRGPRVPLVEDTRYAP